MTEPPEPPEPPESRDPEQGDEEETPEERARRLVGNSSVGPESPEERALRDELGPERFEAMIRAILRRAHEQDADYESGGNVSDDEFWDTDWGQVDRDDQLSDIVGGGSDVDISDEAVTGEQEAADVLSEWRGQIGEVPLPPQLDTDEIIAEHERRKKAEPPAPRTPDTGGTSVMSGPFGEMATQFAALKALVPIEQMHAVETALAQLGEAGSLIIGADLATNWTAKIEEVKAQAAATSDMVDGLFGYIEQTAAKIAAGPGNL